MESANLSKQDKRFSMLGQWLANYFGSDSFSVNTMQGDASFRRYFRVVTPAASYVAMDAPPPQENCAPFVAIARGLRKLDLQVPTIFAADESQGFLLLTDFGDVTYLKKLNNSNANELYSRALSALAKLQRCRQVEGYPIPVFSSEWMWREWSWHKEWFLNKLLGLTPGEHETALDKCFEVIVESAVNQPQVFMHRDYHSANLMVIPDDVGILDFQDAFIGPVTYDLVSLLRDCYIDWPDAMVQQWALDYLALLQSTGECQGVTSKQFLRWFDLMGLERHLKALFTFARKQVRDRQPQYLKHIPRTLKYVLEVSQKYPELSSLHEYMNDIAQPALKGKI